jgi:tRNA 2-thiouridine synthesizing protein A
MSQHQLDTRRLLCPLPVIRTQDRVATLARGDQLTIVGTDPGIMHDIPAWCRLNGHRIIATAQQGREFYITLEVGAES